MDLLKLQNEAWKIAEEKGWHDKPLSFGEFISLCHGELSEALEIFRDKGEEAITRTGLEHETITHYSNGVVDMKVPVTSKPEGIPVELADVIIRILDYCESQGISMSQSIETKMMYNKTRSYRHGGKHL